MVEPARGIDLLVVGDPPLDALYSACALASDRLGLEVTPTVVSADDLAQMAIGDSDASGAPFLRAVQQGDRIEVPIRGDT